MSEPRFAPNFEIDPEAFSEEYEEFLRLVESEIPLEDGEGEYIPDQPEDAHLEAAYEDRFYFEGYEPYEPNPYDGTYSED